MKHFGTMTELMPHQIAAVNKVKPSRAGALFMQMGTGKSRTAIELARLRSRKIDKVIWYCPVSLKETVRQEILKHTDCTDIYVFDDKTRARTIPTARWYIIGIESMSSSNRVVAAADAITTDKTFIILDESSYIKGHNARRTQRITMISERAKYRLILTGTPLSQGVIDLYSQMRFLSPKILGYSSFYSFAANHLEYSEKFPGMIVRAHNVPFIAAKIQPYVYQVTKKECLTLPPKTYESRYFYMTGEQRQWYEQAKDEILADLLEDDDISSIAIFRLFSALQQIVSGFWRRRMKGTKFFQSLEFEHERINTLLSTINEMPPDEKIIIWTKFQHDISQIGQALEAAFGTGSVAYFHGGLNEKKKGEQIQLFRKGARFFLATQSSGGHGLTLNEAHYVIYYNNAFKYSERLQSEDRCHRIGQENKVTYIDISCSSSIDDRIEAALSKKGNAVRAFKDEVDKVKDKKVEMRELIKAL
ncbi:MAG: DEAD/DEAH box helicase [Dehalococcoidales bacterium]|nr:DEAD/DEAH box helicase [Dehalococcoidales bacterium]